MIPLINVIIDPGVHVHKYNNNAKYKICCRSKGDISCYGKNVSKRIHTSKLIYFMTCRCIV